MIYQQVIFLIFLNLLGILIDPVFLYYHGPRGIRYREAPIEAHTGSS